MVQSYGDNFNLPNFRGVNLQKRKIGLTTLCKLDFCQKSQKTEGVKIQYPFLFLASSIKKIRTNTTKFLPYISSLVGFYRPLWNY